VQITVYFVIPKDVIHSVLAYVLCEMYSLMYNWCDIHTVEKCLLHQIFIISLFVTVYSCVRVTKFVLNCTY
jgi:hypothetical protein